MAGKELTRKVIINALAQTVMKQIAETTRAGFIAMNQALKQQAESPNITVAASYNRAN